MNTRNLPITLVLIIIGIIGCEDLDIEIDTSVWFLPSQDELNLLYQQKNVVQGFNGEWYWSSTEYSSTKAMKKNFFTGVELAESKNRKIRVRAIRTF